MVTMPSLHDVVDAGDIEAVDRLLRDGADVRELDAQGVPALQIAAASGYLEIAKLLVDHGADVDFLIEGGGTPLMGASACLRPKLIEFLLAQGAKPNKTGVNGRFALICPFQPSVAEVDKQIECIRLLVAAGARVNQRTDFGDTPLMNASWFGNAEAAEELLRLGADPMLRDSRGRTAAMMAFERGHDELAKLLKRHADARASGST